ncbi:hypothetical protein ACFOY8_14185 [Thalassospira xianhensis]|uniref:Uncharacterized protein n=1 Tax=Thalassospira xianhensis MCCC 1A02616 TaxID=1177929 RepID=A0A367UHA1_9PROT|nr:hypothetical protein [Thalassospira xianhensis]RCK07695.1 hypothetical protein TH5_01080 [Thalassospira xianhensis MCCC 1A02616]
MVYVASNALHAIAFPDLLDENARRRFRALRNEKTFREKSGAMSDEHEGCLYKLMAALMHDRAFGDSKMIPEAGKEGEYMLGHPIALMELQDELRSVERRKIYQIEPTGPTTPSDA